MYFLQHDVSTFPEQTHFNFRLVRVLLVTTFSLQSCNVGKGTLPSIIDPCVHFHATFTLSAIADRLFSIFLVLNDKQTAWPFPHRASLEEIPVIYLALTL